MCSVKLKDWGLPDCILDNYAMLGLNEMFKWQNECLSLPGVLDGKNLIVSAPTSAGKTLIVEVLIAKRVLGTHRKAILVFPFVSLAREKMFHLRRLFDGTGVTVDGYMGGLSPPGGFSSVDIAICTIEKANNIINKLIEEKSTEQIAMLVVDELHMIGDDGRGYLLELLLTKIRYLHLKQASCSCQVIGLSATITNLDLFSTWLNGVVFQTNFRPVPLARYIKVGKEIFDENFIKQRDFEPQVTFMEDDDDITALCYETTRNNHSVLMFCPTKKWCENLANQISKNFQQLNISTTEKHQGRASVLEQLKRSPAGLDPLLSSSIPYGVAFHHAGLTTEERDVLESGFRQGHLLILVATSTLSSGVNLPARRVIIRTPTFHRAVLQQRVYEQMTGRAGRKGESDTGESILICRPNERNQAKILASSIIPSVESCLVGKLQQKSTVRMERAILEVIGNGLVTSINEVVQYIGCSFLHAQLASQSSSSQRRRRSSNTPLKLLDDIIHTCVDWLVSNEFIYVQQYEQESQPESKKVAATQFGRASLFSSLPTDHSLQVLADLQIASRAFALDSELHIVYQITPLNVINDWALDWSRYLSIYENLSSSHQRVAVLIGIDEGVLTRMSLGGGRARVSNKLQQRITIHKRFYAALILHDILQEVPFDIICNKYDCNRGMVQALQQSAASFAGMVTAFCHELVWWCMELLFNEFQSRLLFGVQRELLDLTRIPLLNNKRARGLYEAGLTTCKLVADAKTSYVESILRNACKFQSKRQLYGDNAWDVEDRRNLHVIKVVGSSEGLTESEAAVAIIAHAKVITEYENRLPRQTAALSQASYKPTQNHTPKVSRIDRNLSFVENQSQVLNVVDLNISIPNVISNYCATIIDSKTAHNISCELSTSLCGNNRSIVTKHSTPHISRMSMDMFQTTFNDTSEFVLDASPELKTKTPNPPMWHTKVTPGAKYNIIHVKDKRMAEFLEMWSNEKMFAFSINADMSGNEPQLTGLSLCWSTNIVFYIDVKSLLSTRPTIIKDLQGIVSRMHRSVAQIAFCMKDQYKALLHHSVQLQGSWQDPMIAGWLLEPDNSKQGLSHLIQLFAPHLSYLLHDTQPNWDVNKPSYMFNHDNDHLTCSVECIASYCIMLELRQQLVALDMWKHFTEVEMPHMLCAAQLEINGIGVDVTALKQHRLELQSAALALQEQAWGIVGRKFNLSNPAEIAKILFKELRLTLQEKKSEPTSLRNLASKKFNRSCSTGKEVLQNLCAQDNPHPLPSVIMQWRSINYALNKIILISSSLTPPSERLHHRCLTLTNTGRMILAEPNIQSIPKKFTIKLPQNNKSDDLFSEQSYCLRNIFIATKGHLFISADYSQIELRILAHLCGDDALIKAFNSTDDDIFKSIAFKFFPAISSADQVSDEQRNTAKQICYGILYGMGAQTLAQQMHTTEALAQQTMDSFLRSYPKIKLYFNKLIAKCKERGYIETISGRRRKLPEINSSRLKLRSHAERQAINSTIQGSAADIVKTATCHINSTLHDMGWNTVLSCNRPTEESCYLTHHIHDELIYQTSEHRVHEAARVIQHCMVNAWPLNIRLKVRIKVGFKWGSLDHLDLD